jgi:hypothetical protein
VGGTPTTRGDIDYKASLRVWGQPNGQYGSFDHSDDRVALVVAFRKDLDVWVLWDATLHPRFKNGGNIQVRTSTVIHAAATGSSLQERRLVTGHRELVLACTSARLPETVEHRVLTMGGLDAPDLG